MGASPVLAAQLVDYLPVASTVVAAAFTVVLWRHWKESPRRYLLWWTVGIALYGVGTATEALTTILGWNEGLFRSWYIAGALLGGAPLAQGTAYLLLRRRTADRFAVALVTYVLIAASFVIATPIAADAVDGSLDGDVMEWQWVRLFSPLINTYAVIFLVGGAIWSAVRYWRRHDRPMARVQGNALIAVGAILPGIGGGFARAGTVEVLYVMELLGLILIWAGYRMIARDATVSVHSAQADRPLTTSEVRT